ncbi:MAG: hypothetical protein RTV31_03315 [Candidatus Thorarchaeota archaeon]
MNKVDLFLVLLTSLFMFSTAVCGGWMLTQETVTQGNILFHTQVGGATVLFTFLLMFRLVRSQR